MRAGASLVAEPDQDARQDSTGCGWASEQPGSVATGSRHGGGHSEGRAMCIECTLSAAALHSGFLWVLGVIRC